MPKHASKSGNKNIILAIGIIVLIAGIIFLFYFCYWLNIYVNFVNPSDLIDILLYTAFVPTALGNMIIWGISATICLIIGIVITYKSIKNR